MLEHDADDPEQAPDDPGALTRQELLAQALDFAGEIVRWKVWYVKGYEPGPVQASLSEAEAIQALSQILVALLEGTMEPRLRARSNLATVALYLGYVLQEPMPTSEPNLSDPERIQKLLELHDDVAFLRRYGLRFPDDDSPRGTS